MKKIALFLFFALTALSLKAQVQTVITGKVLNRPDYPIILLVYNFDTTTMKEEETTISAKIKPDSTFTISTEKVLRPFTRCRLGFRNEGQEIALSPGDTLQTRFECGNMETSMGFEGKGAGVNLYLKEYQQSFSRNSEMDLYGNRGTADTSLISAITSRRDAKLSILNIYYAGGQIDTLFYEYENSRISFEYFDDLIRPGVPNLSRDSAYDNRVLNIIGQVKYSREGYLIELKDYRQFLLHYVNYRAELTAGRNPNLQDRLNLINTELTGLSKTYCSFELITEAITRTLTSPRALVLRDYFVNQTDDPNLVQLLNGLDLRTYYPGGHTYRKILGTALNFMVVFLVIALLLFLLYQVRVYLLKMGKQLNSMVVIRIAIYLTGILFICMYLFYDVHSGNVILPMLRVVVLLAFAGVQVFWLIPVWFQKGRYQKYCFLLFLISIAYFMALYTMGRVELSTHPRFQWLESGSILFIVNSWIILVPFAFLNHYVNLLIRKDKMFDYLLKEKLVSAEAILHVIFLMIVLSATFTNSYHHLKEFSYFLLGLAIFYSHAFSLIPRYLSKRKIAAYLIGSLGGFGATFLVVYLSSLVEMYLTVKELGIRVSFSDFFIFPDRMMLFTAAALQIIIIPALIYDYLRQQIGQKNIGFKLFHNKEAELNQLRSQVNPHFLFNSLNTLYAFALKESNTKTAEYIAKLANLMRYLVDDMEKERIPVQKEISYIRDYINLQTIRSSVEHKIEINNEIEEHHNILIAPMLMIPFVENAFKHGINPNLVSELKVTFQIHDGRFQFVIENSVDKNFETFYKEKGFGIGIPNVRQRLEYIYPGRHTLSIADTGDRFIVILNIELETMEYMERG